MGVPPPDPTVPGRRHYPLSFQLDAVRAVEAGETQQAVSQRLGVSQTALQVWLKRHGTAVYAQRKKHVFSPALKRQIVGEILDGLSYGEAQVKYGVRHLRSLRDWVAAHRAVPDLPSPLARTAPPTPEAPLPDSPAELASELRQARWQLEALHTLIDHAEATYGIEIRKKAGAKRST